MKFANQGENTFRIRAVEVPGRLVGEQQIRLHRQRSGHRHPLLLAAGKLIRKVVGPVGQRHRIEELRAGKTVRMAIQNGFDRVWITIIDTHLTGLIAAAFLFQFGTGPIKGFAVTVVIGLCANVFASFFVSRLLFEWILGKRHVEKLSI